MTIVFVGDKPSKKNVNPKIPFVGTQSYKKLLEWIWEMDINITNVELRNASEPWVEGYLAMCEKLGNDNVIDDIKFVCLGNKASDLFTKYSHPHFKLPHPSGLNRKTNDKKYIKEQLKLCKEYINERN